jgi:3-deoxy-manno-octulosonate cytidylyltransferase (CMP-KDO synthetase)
VSSAGGSSRPRAIAVIPARYESTRLPGKPLLEAGGRSLIEHVYRQVRRARSIDAIVVATDDRRIAEAVAAFGGEARLTSPDHPSGSDRIGELLPGLDAEILVNVQGDEPEIDPETIDGLVAMLTSRPEIQVATAAVPFPADVDPADPNTVKVVLGAGGRALYFSRSLVPYPRAGAESVAPLLHLGIYAYRRDALSRFLALPVGRLEGTESLEQLRLLENGIPIAVVLAAAASPGIDTPEDLAAFRQRLESSPSAGSDIAVQTASPSPQGPDLSGIE